MAAELLYPDQTLTAGVDGRVPLATLPDDLCAPCVDIPCADEPEYLCSFVDLLPCGPMWDRHKTLTREAINEAGGIPVGGFDCVSMSTAAVLIGATLSHNVRTILGGQLREASPYTAVLTRSDWLQRLGWVDCYRSFCRTPFMAQVSPYEHQGDCGSEYCEFDFPELFEAALEFAIIRSLLRVQRAGVKNLNVLNWIIEPLAAELQVPNPWPDAVQAELDNPSADPACFGCSVQLTMASISDTLQGAPTEASFCGDTPDVVDSLQTYTCDGVDTQLRPSLFAAECIIRSVMRSQCPDIIVRQ